MTQVEGQLKNYILELQRRKHRAIMKKACATVDRNLLDEAYFHGQERSIDRIITELEAIKWDK